MGGRGGERHKIWQAKASNITNYMWQYLSWCDRTPTPDPVNYKATQSSTGVQNLSFWISFISLCWAWSGECSDCQTLYWGVYDPAMWCLELMLFRWLNTDSWSLLSSQRSHVGLKWIIFDAIQTTIINHGMTMFLSTQIQSLCLLSCAFSSMSHWKRYCISLHLCNLSNVLSAADTITKIRSWAFCGSTSNLPISFGLVPLFVVFQSFLHSMKKMSI